MGVVAMNRACRCHESSPVARVTFHYAALPAPCTAPRVARALGIACLACCGPGDERHLAAEAHTLPLKSKGFFHYVILFQSFNRRTAHPCISMLYEAMLQVVVTTVAAYHHGRNRH